MRKFLLILLLFISISLFFFYPVLGGDIPFPGDLLVGEYNPYSSNTYQGYGPGAVTHKAQGPDVIRQLFPWKYLAVSQWKRGEIPFWNPYNFSGNPLMANFQSGVFYPFNIVLFSDFINGWTLYIFITPFLASLFLYFFLRELSLSRISSVFGGIVFAFSSYMSVWVEYGNIGHTFLWFPLTLFLIERFIKKFQNRYLFFLLLVWSFSLLAGYIQGYFYILLVDLFYFIIRSSQLKKVSFKKAVLFFLLCGIPFLLCAFQIIPTIELFLYSSRGNYSLSQIERLLNPWWYVVTTFIPNFFGNPASRNHWFYGTYVERVSYFGFIPLLFSLSAITYYRIRREVTIFSIIFIVSFLLSLDMLFVKFIYLIPIPTLSTTVPTRILSLFQFSGSILGAFGLEFFLKEKIKPSFIRILFGFLIFFLLLWVGLFVTRFILPNAELTKNIHVVIRNTIFPTVLLLVFSLAFLVKVKSFKRIRIIPVLIIFLATCIDLFYFFHKITPFSPREYVYPKTEILTFLKQNGEISRVWGYGEAYLENNFATYEQVYTTDGYDPLFSKRYSELLATTKNGKIPEIIPRSDANILPGYGQEDLPTNYFRQKILNLLGVEFLLKRTTAQDADYSTFQKDTYSLFWQKGNWHIYKNNVAFPRYFLAPDYILEKDKEKIIQKIFDKNFNSTSVILEEALSQNLRDDKNARVSLVIYQPNTVRFKTSSKSDMILFLSDNYYPGWNVSIDGIDTSIYRANFAFRAVPVKKGEHEIKFWYYPKSFDIGLKISIATIILILITGLLTRNNIFKKNAKY